MNGIFLNLDTTLGKFLNNNWKMIWLRLNYIVTITLILDWWYLVIEKIVEIGKLTYYLLKTFKNSTRIVTETSEKNTYLELPDKWVILSAQYSAVYSIWWEQYHLLGYQDWSLDERLFYQRSYSWRKHLGNIYRTGQQLFWYPKEWN